MEKNTDHENTGVEVKAHKDKKPPKSRKPIIIGLIILFVGASAAGIWYYEDQQKYVYTDKATVSAPLIQLTPKSPGILKDVMVYEGEQVFAHQTVARVGDDVISAEIPGVVIMAKQDIGAVYNPGQAVVTMIDPKELRIVARIEEDKGLKDIKVLDKVFFTVDSYGSQRFEGMVEEISNTSRTGDVVFNISDKREEQEYEVKIRYDAADYPAFLNGMSAKVWIVK